MIYLVSFLCYCYYAYYTRCLFTQNILQSQQFRIYTLNMTNKWPRLRMIAIFNKGMASIIEQGLFSGISFITSLLLGRWFIPDDYGAYSVAMSIFLLIAGLYTSLILEPLSIYGPQVSFDNKKVYYGAVLLFHIFISGILLTGAVIFSYFWHLEGASIVRIMSLNIPFILLYWLIRWKYYNESNPKKVLFHTFFYSLILFLFLIILKKIDILSPEIVFIYSGLTSVVISVFSLWKTPLSFRKYEIKIYALRHWNYGKWLLLASLLQWLSMQIYLVFVATKLSVADSGGYRAIQNFAAPIEQISTAMGLLFIPWVAKRYKDNKYILNNIHAINVLLGIIGAIYLLFMWFAKNNFIDFVYQGKYNGYSWLLPYLIGVPIIFSLSKGSQIGIRVIQKPYLLLVSYGISSAFTLIFGPILIDQYGIFGAAIGRLTATLLFSIVINILYLQIYNSLKKTL